MKRRRISTQLVEKTIQDICPFYKLTNAYRPDGEYINGSKYVFTLTEDKPGYPKTFTFADYTKEDERMDFGFEYPEGEQERIKGANVYYIFTNIKSAIGSYSGFLDLGQVEEVVKRALNDVFTPKYLEDNKGFFEAQVNAMSHFYFEEYMVEGDKMKAGVLYGKLKEEMIYMPMRNAFGHFVFTFTGVNEFDKPDRIIMPGEIYSVYLPIGDDSELGGGNKRPCLIIGKSSTNRYFVSPIYHSENPKTMDEEYFLDQDADGRPRYITRGVVYSVPSKDIYTEQPRCKKEDYERILRLIGRDNQIMPGIHDFHIGLGSTTSGDIYKSQINYYDNTFELPQPKEFLKTIAHALKKMETKAGKQIFVRNGEDFAYDVMTTEDGYLLKLLRIDETVPLIIKMDKDLPVDIFSNRKEIEYNVVGKHEFAPDQALMASYRYCMSRKYPMFKFMLLKRIVKLFNAHYYADKFAGVDDVGKYTTRLKRLLNACMMEYDGDYEELIKEGIEKIVFTKLRFTTSDKSKKSLQKTDDDEIGLE